MQASHYEWLMFSSFHICHLYDPTLTDNAGYRVLVLMLSRLQLFLYVITLHFSFCVDILSWCIGVFASGFYPLNLFLTRFIVYNSGSI